VQQSEEHIRGEALAVLAEIAPEAAAVELDPARAFRDQIEMDSVDYLNFVMRLEKRLGLKVAEVDYPKLASLDGCVRYLAPRHTGRT
jgi:acyl carrier protein